MKRILAIARLTFWEGIRMKIVLVFVVVLLFVVLRLPFALRGDETLSGRLQTFLSYSLGALSVFMGLATVFLSCATLTRDIQECSIHLVVTKPVSRFQILFGKWLGVNALNVLMIILSGLVIYGFAVYIKSRPEQFMRDRLKLSDTVWTSRIAALPAEPDFEQFARERVEELEERGREFLFGKEQAVHQIAQEEKQKWKRIGPREGRIYTFEGLPPPRSAETVYQVRFKAQAVPLAADETLYIHWVLLDPETHAPLPNADRITDERSDVRHQFLVRSSVVRDGKAEIAVINPPSNKNRSIYFSGDESLEILYRVGSFEGNLVKSLLLIVFRLAFLSALGLFFGTFVSFPVACFCVLSIFLFCVGVPWWLESIGANMQRIDPKVDPYGWLGPFVRPVLVPVLKIALPNFVAYDGVGRLIDGYAIPNSLMLRSAAHTLVYGVVLLVLPGWLIFRSREIAETVV
ncbi:MAG: ABC transporter permease [Phycisphaerae bacterium]